MPTSMPWATAAVARQVATGRTWKHYRGCATERHLKLINRINDLITAADARGQAMQPKSRRPPTANGTEYRLAGQSYDTQSTMVLVGDGLRA